jgi:hypothetical protein
VTWEEKLEKKAVLHPAFPHGEKGDKSVFLFLTQARSCRAELIWSLCSYPMGTQNAKVIGIFCSSLNQKYCKDPSPNLIKCLDLLLASQIPRPFTLQTPNRSWNQKRTGPSLTNGF